MPIYKNLRVRINEEIANPGGNWNTAKDWFPTIEVDQPKKLINIATYATEGRQKKATIDTDSIDYSLSKNKDQCLITGEISCKNWSNYKCSGSQKFVFACFVGDSGHIYTHRAPATKGWLNCDPENIRKRLVKLGIGATDKVIQQGDFLLKPANSNAYPDEEFKHETMGAGHHKFECPVLYAYGDTGRQYKITEPTQLIHEAVDGIQHPTVTIPKGVWIVGTTANQLSHSNKRD